MGVRSFDPTTDTYHCFFLSPKIPIHTTSELTPTNKFTIFWHQHLATDIIIDDTVTDPFVFEMNGDDITLKYAKEPPYWSIV